MIALAPSVVLGDRYRLERRIAGGGMGEVWRARDIVLERPVAVKVLRPELAEDASFRQRFLVEARHAALLAHPGIAGVFDFGEDDGTPYLVMELVEGETLAALLAREGRLSAGQTMSIVGQAGLALQAAHDAGVVHRDVKPGNLMVRPDGAVKVTDFGIARALAGAAMTMTGNVLGTVHYISPEQARGERATPASDTYALGVVAWECLSGRRPFPYESPIAIATAHATDPVPPLATDVPGKVAALVARATEKEPALRPLSAGEFGREALALAAGLADDVAGPSATVRAAGPADTIVIPALAGRAPDRAPDRTPDRTQVLPPIAASLPILEDPPPGRSRRRRPLARLVLALLVIGAIVAVALLASAGGTTPRHPSPGSSTPAGVTLDPARYVGRPYPEVAAALGVLGLRAQPVIETSTTVPADTVLRVPSGPFAPGDTVRVTVSSGPSQVVTPAPGSPGESGKRSKGDGKGKD